MKFVINRSDAIGDTVLTLPMAEVIKKSYPESKVIFIVRSLTEPLFKNNPFVDELWVTPKKGLFKYFLGQFKKERPENYIYVGGSHIPSVCAFLTGVSSRGGLISKWPSLLFLNEGLRQKRSQVQFHERDYNLKLLEPFNIPFNKTMPGPKLYIDNGPSLEFKKETIVIHPGMTGHTLNWPAEYYVDLIHELQKIYPGRFEFIFSYTPSDQSYIDKVKERLKKYSDLKVNFLDGSIDGLWHYLKVLKKASLFIGPSTGTTHMANALGVKVLTFYSPVKSQSQKRWAPFYQGENVTQLLEPSVQCEATSKCLEKSCPYFDCMGKISVEMALDRARLLIN